MFGACFAALKGTKRISQRNFEVTPLQFNPCTAAPPSYETLIHSSCNFGEQTLQSPGGGDVVKVQSASRYNPGQTIPAKTPSPSGAPWCFWAERRSRGRSGTLRRKSTVTANDDVSLPRQRQLRGGGRWLCCRKQHGGNRLGMLTGN